MSLGSKNWFAPDFEAGRGFRNWAVRGDNVQAAQLRASQSRAPQLQNPQQHNQNESRGDVRSSADGRSRHVYKRQPHRYNVRAQQRRAGHEAFGATILASLPKTTVGNAFAPTALSLHNPSSPETTAAMRFAANVERADLAHSFWALIPARIDHGLVGSVAMCLDKAEGYRSGRLGASEVLSMRWLNNVISVVRVAMASSKAVDSDDCILAIVLLSVIHLDVFGPREAHIKGFLAVASAQEAAKTTTDVTRAVCTFTPFAFAAFAVHIAKGIASPLDTPEWLAWEAAPHPRVQPEAARLKKLALQLFAQLPRLILLVRKARSHEPLLELEAMTNAISFAEQLLSLEDKDAESGLLHAVGVSRAAHPADAQVAPFALQFRSRSGVNAAIYYWQTRIHVLRLCRRLVKLNHEQALSISVLEMEGEMSRIGKNILMSFESHLVQTYGSGVAGIGSLPALWGCLHEFQLFPKLDTQLLEGWILQNVRLWMQIPTGMTTSVLIRKLNETEDHLVGGPLAGLLVDRYS